MSLSGAHDPSVNVRVKFDGGSWRAGKLRERMSVTDHKVLWKIVFADGSVQDDIDFGSGEMAFQFEASAYGEEVKMFCAAKEEWRTGYLVTLIKGDGLFGVEFDTGEWVENVRIHSSYIRYTDPLKEADRKKKMSAGKEKQEDPEKKMSAGKEKQEDPPEKKMSAGKEKPKPLIEPTWDISYIVGDKTVNGIRMMKVHWLDWDSSEDTWEPFTQLCDDMGTDHVRALVEQYNAGLNPEEDE
jgi:hypothetical protein